MITITGSGFGGTPECKLCELIPCSTSGPDVYDGCKLQAVPEARSSFTSCPTCSCSSWISLAICGSHA